MSGESPPISTHNQLREKLLAHDAAALSDTELLAVILRTDSTDENALSLSEQLIARHSGLHGLAHASAAELQQFKGLGQAKIAQILAVMEISRRLMVAAPDERPIINTASDAARLIMDMGHLTQEHVRVVLLDMSRRVIATPTVYIGTLNASVLRVSEIFREAITRNSPAILLAHNHPSGDPAPSPEDIELTRTLIAAGNLLDIALLDHLIVGHYGWTSLKEMGLAFT